MRTTGLILILVFISFISVRAQMQVPFAASRLNDSNQLKKNWSVSAYSVLTTGFGFYGGGNYAGFSPVQIGMQVNRRLNNNLYAFAGVGATPAYFNFNRPIANTGAYKNYMGNPGFGANSYGIYPGIQAGLMYVNDQKTFSISGSIGVSRNAYSAFPSPPGRVINSKQSNTGARQ